MEFIILIHSAFMVFVGYWIHQLRERKNKSEFAKYIVLTLLQEMNRPMHLNEIREAIIRGTAGLLYATAETFSGVLKTMQSLGWVREQGGLFSITDRGKAILEERNRGLQS